MPHLHDRLSTDPRMARERLLGFIEMRVGDRALAEDVLQDSFLKALRAAPTLRDEDRLVPWFYQIVRSAIVDAQRRRGRTRRALDRLAAEPTEPVAAGEAAVCACVRGLVQDLDPGLSAVIEADLAERDAAETAAALGISRGALKVRRHRARQHLRTRLEVACGVCAEHGCLDCDC